MVTDRFDSLSRIGKVKAPILILHGERDRVVPVRYGRALLDAASEPKEGGLRPKPGTRTSPATAAPMPSSPSSTAASATSGSGQPDCLRHSNVTVHPPSLLLHALLVDLTVNTWGKAGFP
jgi:hypothetical protein